ncbi:MAG: serine/threonine protein kinase [Myxococcales bacterium]|nr:serine/threonine protein kinase [Myxococcales bacterium]
MGAGSRRLFADRYLLLRELGRGGMGAVYAAYDEQAMRRVALKRIEAKPGQDVEMLEQRFRREVRALAASKHPGTPTLLHCGRAADGAAYYTMEIVAGERLRSLLERERLTSVRALTLAIDVGRILASMHEVGVVHRDVKPGNILVEAGDRVRLIDFGACAFLPQFFLREDIERDRLTATDLRWATGDYDAVRTPGYSAPEVGRAEEDASVRNDIYSLCAITYEMVTGRSLVDRHSQAVRTIVPEELPAPLAPLAEILAGGTSFEQFDRQRSMPELVQALEVVRGELLRGPGRPPRQPTATVTLALAAALIAALAWSARGGPPLAAPVSPPPDAAAPQPGAPSTDAATRGPAPPAPLPDPPSTDAATRGPAPPAPLADPPDPPPGSATERDESRAGAAPPDDPPHEAPATDPGKRRRRILEGRREAVERCAADTSGVLTTLTVAVAAPRGRVTDVTLVEHDAPVLEHCVAELLRGLQLPASGDPILHTYRLRPRPHR